MQDPIEIQTDDVRSKREAARQLASPSAASIGLSPSACCPWSRSAPAELASCNPTSTLSSCHGGACGDLPPRPKRINLNMPETNKGRGHPAL